MLLTPDDFKDIVYSLDSAGIATLTLNTPARKNALSGLTCLEIFYAVEHFKQDDAAHALIITGAPDPKSDDPAKQAFSSGGYFSPDAFDGVSDAVMQDIDMKDIAQKRTVMAMLTCDKPVIAAVNGLAVGGGATLCLAGADQVYMSEHAWLQLPFAKLGIAPELASSFILPRLLGFQKAKELLFFPERIPAEQAADLGIANAVVPHAELMRYAREKATQLIPPTAPAMAIRKIKQLLHAPHLDSFSQALDLENEVLNELFKSEDFAEGLTARVEKRPAVFKGN